MKRVIVLLSVAVFLTVSCEEKEIISQVSDVSFTPCQQDKQKSDSDVDVKFTKKGVQITYHDFAVTCDFTTVNVTHTFTNGVLNITQQGSPNQANCICYTDVSYTICGILENEVNVIFINGIQVYCHSGNGEEGTFCSYLNVENIDKTIPFINDFLAGLPSSSSFAEDEQNLQALTIWLKSKPCIIDASILCVSCIYTLPAQSEIAILFEENGKTVKVVFDILMSNPLKAIRVCSIDYIYGNQCDKDVIIDSAEYENAPNHPIHIIDMKIVDNCLKIKFGASGCTGDNWVVELIDSEIILDAIPCQRTLRLSLEHIGICAAYFENEMSFNIEDLQIYGNNSVQLNVSGNWILYEY